MTRPNTPGAGAGSAGMARWCEQSTKAGNTCPRLAVVLVADFYGWAACVCRDHWHHLHHTTGGAVRAIQLLPRTPGNGRDDSEGTR